MAGRSIAKRNILTILAAFVFTLSSCKHCGKEETQPDSTDIASRKTVIQDNVAMPINPALVDPNSSKRKGASSQSTDDEGGGGEGGWHQKSRHMRKTS
jgi:hypothetical protein